PPKNFYGWGRVDILAAISPAPIQCPLCWFLQTRPENFDSLTPPALPPNWAATNAQGPPPLWVTSNSGVPMPPADTLPNAAYIDDPAIVRDKQLVSPSIFCDRRRRPRAGDLPQQLQFAGRP